MERYDNKLLLSKRANLPDLDLDLIFAVISSALAEVGDQFNTGEVVKLAISKMPHGTSSFELGVIKGMVLAQAPTIGGGAHPFGSKDVETSRPLKVFSSRPSAAPALKVSSGGN